MKITKRKLKKILSESLYSDLVDTFFPNTAGEELKHPIGESDMYSSPENHMRLLLALRKLPDLLENAKIPDMSEKRAGITEEESHVYVQLANLLSELQ